MSENRCFYIFSTEDKTSILYNYILSEMNQLKNEVRKTALQWQPIEIDDSYNNRIFSSLKQLNEIVKNGIPNSIFSKNYTELKEQIFSVNDADFRNILLNALEDIKQEHEKYMQ